MSQLEKQYYPIGKVSKICNIPIRTLHHYNDIGLLKPIKVDSNTHYRYYSHEQLSHINVIKHFKKAGFSLKEIIILLERNDITYNEYMIKSKCQEIENTISELTILKNRLKLYLAMNPKDQNTIRSLHIEVKEIPVVTVAFSRYKGPCTPDEFYLRYTKLNNLIETHQFHMTGTMMAIYYDDYRTFDYTNADIEVCVTVAEQESYEGILRSFGGHLAAVVTHYGSYKTMNTTYSSTLEWLDKNGFKYVGGAVENYIIDVVTTVYEDDYITEIILPIQKMI